MISISKERQCVVIGFLVVRAKGLLHLGITHWQREGRDLLQKFHLCDK